MGITSTKNSCVKLQATSDVEVSHLERIFLNEIAAVFDDIVPQREEASLAFSSTGVLFPKFVAELIAWIDFRLERKEICRTRIGLIELLPRGVQLVG